MEHFYSNPDDILTALFPDGNYSSIFETDVQLSGGVELEFDDPNQSLLPFDSNNNGHDFPNDTEGYLSPLELNHILTDTQDDANAIFNTESLVQNSTIDQNAEMINIPIPQQASGSQNGIMYLMYPSLFDFINNVMSVKQQPKANNRSRYECDGRRFLPDSRYHPMAINLPDLRSIVLASNQKLGIVMTLGTSTNNPMNQTFVHANDIIYGEADTEKIAYGCVFVPLQESDITNNEKKFNRLSILYKKYEDYSFNLIPFNAYTMFGTTETYAIPAEPDMEKVRKGKLFKEEYNLLSYKIIFQLALKQDNVIYISNITCETETINEQLTPPKSSKRSASVSTEGLSEEESSCDTQVSNASKKFKSTAPPLIGLPVTRVSNLIIESDMDHQQ